MKKLIASAKKEILTLWRDRIGLVLLFLMPMVFVFVITLIQDYRLDDGEKKPVTVLLFNFDKGSQLTDELITGFAKNSLMQVTIMSDKSDTAFNQAERDVALGKYQGIIVIAKDASSNFEKYSKQLLVGLASDKIKTEPIKLILDPNLFPAVKYSVENAIAMMLQQLQIKTMQQVMHQSLGSQIQLLDNPVQYIQIEYAKLNQQQLNPNAVQQNVPAWAIFGMFFIVVPAASTFIREREQGVLQRLLIAPVGLPTILLGKIFAYMVINLIQLTLMIIVGKTLLPWFGTPTLTLGVHPELIPIIAVCASLAATGVGILFGTFLKTYEQASVLGSMSVVIAAAIGGIMVPVYLMPAILQKIGIISPLRWANDAFIGVFVRGAGIVDILPQLLLLFGFFLFCILLAWGLLRRKA